MPSSVGNPYTIGSAEHDLWERWHQAFFAEPIHSQLYAIESDLQEAFSMLIQSSNEIPLGSVRAEIRTHLLKVEAAMLLLNEAAEHAYQSVVSAPALRFDGRTIGIESDSGAERDEG